jgi:plastocyanin
MRPRIPVSFFALACALAVVPSAESAQFFVQTMPNNTFSNANLTIQAGDTVTFSNGGGFHNVAADDDSFRCANGCDGMEGNGSPSSTGWSFSLTFNDVGTVTYNCEVHVGQGMRGTIVVEGGAPQDPGNLSFAQATRQIGEGAGSVNLTVNRTAGSDGAVSVSFSTANGSANAGPDYTAKSGSLSWGDGDSGAKTISVNLVDDGDIESNETFTVALQNPTGGAGLVSPSTATVTIIDNDDNSPAAGTLAFASSSVSVGEAAGSTDITVTRSGGSDGAVSVDYATADGSAMAGSDYGATSGTLAWVDGDSATQTFEVTIFDDALEEGNETINLSLSDPTGGATLGTSASTLTVVDDEQTPADCTPDTQTLCLGENGRFKVEVSFSDFEGNDGVGKTFDIGKQDSGLIFFFNENNIEMLIKVNNACVDPFNTYWVFFAATTNLEFLVTVTDTVANVSKEYPNELGHAAEPVLDINAFATCP